LIKKLPHLGDEAERFEEDIKRIVKNQPSMPEKDKWV